MGEVGFQPLLQKNRYFWSKTLFLALFYFFRCTSISWFYVVSEWASDSPYSDFQIINDNQWLFIIINDHQWWSILISDNQDYQWYSMTINQGGREATPSRTKQNSIWKRLLCPTDRSSQNITSAQNVLTIILFTLYLRHLRGFWA